MSASPLPDIRRIRQVTLVLLGVLYAVAAALYTGFQTLEPLTFEVLSNVSGVFALLWVAQWAVLAGAPRPQQRSHWGLIILLAIGLGLLDALLVGGWNGLVMAVFSLLNSNNSGPWVSFFGVLGFVFGFLMVLLLGFRLSKYDFLRLVLLIHLLGCACQSLFVFLDKFYGVGYGRSHHPEMMPILSKLAIFAGVVVLIWGIAPIVYLITYRDYRKRLALTANEDSDPLVRQ